jgi:alkylation response protein AidB-like acyl-CoA dehydrogenase
MDFTFSAEQEAMRDSVRAVVTGFEDAGSIRAVIDNGDADVMESMWATIVGLGWPGLLIPEEQGGLGRSLVDAAVVLEELGRVVMPGPFLSSAVLAVTMAKLLGSHDLLVALAKGERGTVALEEQGHGDLVDRVRTRAIRKGNTWQLVGHKAVVLDADTADWIIVAARIEDGIGSFLVRDLDVHASPMLDPSRRGVMLDLDQVVAEPIGPKGDHSKLWRRLADDGAVALAAELVGVCDRAIALSVAYAKSRVQFDVPIASHQVIQHKFVDMLHHVEMGRVGVHFAAWASDVDDPQRSGSAAIAKSHLGEGAVAVTSQAIQVHGAVGFTWDASPQLLFKRAKQNDVLFGTSSWHRQRISDAVLAPA